MVQHYALKPKASTCTVPVEYTLGEPAVLMDTNPHDRKDRRPSKRVFSTAMGHMEASGFKGIVSDHGPNLLYQVIWYQKQQLDFDVCPPAFVWNPYFDKCFHGHHPSHSGALYKI